MMTTRWQLVPILVAGLMLAAGCNKSDDGKGPTKDKPATEHGHPDHGPHQGVLAEWGEEDYHVEFTVDHKAQEAVVYVLDGSAKKAAPIKARELTLTLKLSPPVTLKLAARPEKDDPAGSSSRFAGKHEAFGKEQPFAGTISAEVDDKPFTGDFREKPAR